MTRYIVAGALALAAVALTVLSAAQYRDGRASGTQLTVSIGGGVSALVCAGAVALGGAS